MTYDPIRDELFSAQKGSGTFLNDRSVNVSQAARLVDSIIATGFPYKRATILNNNLQEFNRVLPGVQGVRRCGSAALDLAYVAAGRLDGYWEFHLSPWDWGAGMLLVSEAGGMVTDSNGAAWSLQGEGMVATNGLIHDELLHVLNDGSDDKVVI